MCESKPTNRTEVDGVRKHDPDFKGPVKKRSCTDVLCLMVFLVGIAALVWLAAWSFIMGDYRRVVFPKDSNGKVCGVDYPERKYLFFFDIHSCLDLPDVVIKFGCPTTQVCVSSCPNYTWTQSSGDSFDSREKMICVGGVSANVDTLKSQSISQLTQEGKCAPSISPNDEVLLRCVPKDLLPQIDTRTRMAMENKLQAARPPSFPSLVLGARTILTKILEDLIRTWKVILVCILLSAVVSLLWICLMRFCTCPMIYFTLTLFVGVFGVVTGVSIWRYIELRKAARDPPPFFFTIDITAYFHYANTWLVLGIICGIVLIVVVCLLIFLRKRIALATRVINEASKAIGHIPCALFWPVFPFTLIFGVIVLWLFIDLNLRSIASSEGVAFTNTTAEPQDKLSKAWMQWALRSAVKCTPNSNTSDFCHFVQQIGLSYIPWLQVYNFAMCLWLINFIIALEEATLAGAFATFYFADRRARTALQTSGCCGLRVLLATFGSMLFYHAGSLALGSLLITLLCLIRAILLRLERRLKMAQNPVATFFLRCCGCCFWCLEKFLRFLNRNAYIIMAVYGYGFCHSAKNAFGLILRNVVRVFVVDKLTDFLLFIGKMSICVFSTAMAYIYFSGWISDHFGVFPDKNMHLNYMIVPVLIILLGSFLVAKAFFSVYEMGVDTIFLCVCEDMERNDGSQERPYHMSKSIMKTLKKSEEIGPASGENAVPPQHHPTA